MLPPFFNTGALGSVASRFSNRVEPLSPWGTLSSPTGDPAEAFLISVIPSETPSTAYHAQYEDQQYRSGERSQDRHKINPRHRVTDIEEVESNPASQQTAKHADDNVTNNTVAAPAHDLSRQKSGDQANDNPRKYTHHNPPIDLSASNDLLHQDWLFSELRSSPGNDMWTRLCSTITIRLANQPVTAPVV